MMMIHIINNIIVININIVIIIPQPSLLKWENSIQKIKFAGVFEGSVDVAVKLIVYNGTKTINELVLLENWG